MDQRLKQKLKEIAINRRSFLKGSCQVALGLPLMEFMLDFMPSIGEAATTIFPVRYIIIQHGLSLGMSIYKTDPPSLFNPTNTGANWVPSQALSSINNFPLLKPYVNVITNLSIPYSGSSFNSGPGFNIDTDFHEKCSRIQLVGSSTFNKLSSDQLLVKNLSLSSSLIHMNYRVQPKNYTGSTGVEGSMQFGTNGSELKPQIDPVQAYASLVSGIQTSNTTQTQIIKKTLSQRKSVLDLISKRLDQYLQRTLPANDLKKLSDHKDQIRTLENQLTADINNSQLAASQCLVIYSPAPIPLGLDYVGVPSNISFDSKTGWSNETLRSQLFRDLITMGLSCDRSRIGTLRLTHDQSFISAQNLIGTGMGTGTAKDYHEITHGTGRVIDLTLGIAWHVNEFFQLAEKLRNIPEGNGTVLDNTVLIFISEGGYGKETNSSDFTPHSGDNMAIITAGKAGGSLMTGTHIKANKEHPCSVLLTLMKAAGYSGSAFNDVSNLFPGLLK